VDDTFRVVKRTFDLPYQVEQHPWMMVGGAVVAGYMLGCLGGGKGRRDDGATGYASDESSPVGTYVYHEAARPASERPRGLWDDLRRQLREETGVLLSATITGMTELLRNSLRDSVPQLKPYIEKAMHQDARGKETHQGTQAETQAGAMHGSATSPGQPAAGVSRANDSQSERQTRHL
jgi:hypothetical protein